MMSHQNEPGVDQDQSSANAGTWMALAALIIVSAGLLGTERTGHGVRIRPDGLVATIGYIVHEAESVWIGSSAGGVVPGFVVGYDYESGFGLVQIVRRGA